MSESPKDYCRGAFKEQLSRLLLAQKTDVRTESMQLLDKHRELKQMDLLLKLQRAEFEIKMENLRIRDEKLKNKEEQVKDLYRKVDEARNDAKQALILKNTEADRAATREKDVELQRLQKDMAALLDKKEQMQKRVTCYKVFEDILQAAVTKSTKFKDIKQLKDRFELLMLTQEQLLESQGELIKRRERESSDLKNYIKEQSSKILMLKNTLSKLHTDLDRALEDTVKTESRWNHIETMATKQTRLHGQLKMVILRLFYMTGGITGEHGITVDCTLQQLKSIESYIQDRVEIIKYLEASQPLQIQH